MKAVYPHFKSMKAAWCGIYRRARHNSGRTGRRTDNRAVRRAARARGNR